jgi:hypothetical protein
MKRVLVGSVVLVLSAGMVAYSLAREYRAYREDRPAGDLVFFDTISEAVLVEDSTFAGVMRSEKTGRLISTYDRTQPKGRPACPT